MSFLTSFSFWALISLDVLTHLRLINPKWPPLVFLLIMIIWTALQIMCVWVGLAWIYFELCQIQKCTEIFIHYSRCIIRYLVFLLLTFAAFRWSGHFGSLADISIWALLAQFFRYWWMQTLTLGVIAFVYNLFGLAVFKKLAGIAFSSKLCCRLQFHFKLIDYCWIPDLIWYWRICVY